MDFIKDLLGKKLDPVQFDAIMQRIELRAEQDAARDRAMEEAVKALTRKVEELAGTVADYNMQLRALANRVEALRMQPQRDESARQMATVRQASAAPAAAAETPAKPVARRFYATLNGDDCLCEVGDNYRSKAPIVATVTGDTGEATFNADCLEYCLPRAESAILPFFDCTIASATPATVEPQGPVRITRRGDVWEMSQKIKITLK